MQNQTLEKGNKGCPPSPPQNPAKGGWSKREVGGIEKESLWAWEKVLNKNRITYYRLADFFFLGWRVSTKGWNTGVTPNKWQIGSNERRTRIIPLARENNYRFGKN